MANEIIADVNKELAELMGATIRPIGRSPIPATKKDIVPFNPDSFSNEREAERSYNALKKENTLIPVDLHIACGHNTDYYNLCAEFAASSDSDSDGASYSDGATLDEIMNGWE